LICLRPKRFTDELNRVVGLARMTAAEKVHYLQTLIGATAAHISEQVATNTIPDEHFRQQLLAGKAAVLEQIELLGLNRSLDAIEAASVRKVLRDFCL